jgi:hypothetical protein
MINQSKIPGHDIYYLIFFSTIVGALSKEPMKIGPRTIPSVGFVVVAEEFEGKGYASTLLHHFLTTPEVEKAANVGYDVHVWNKESQDAGEGGGEERQAPVAPARARRAGRHGGPRLSRSGARGPTAART